MQRRVVFAGVASLTFGCGGADALDGDQPPAWSPELACPSAESASCPPGEATSLRAAAAVRSVVPTCWEAWTDANDDQYYDAGDESFLDCGCDRRCPDDPGYTAPDEGEGDGVFQAVWLAGFGNGRPANGVRDGALGMIGQGDGLDARVLVLDQDATRVAIATVDAVGIMYDQVLEIRAAVAARGLDIDHVIVHSSHTHSGPDTMGIFGPSISRTGFQQRYADQIAAAVADAAAEAVGALVEVELRTGEADLNVIGGEKGVGNVIRDSRDPNIVDPRVGVASFVHDGATVATLVHWANHPETIADDNLLMTSDFVHGVRKVVSEGSRWPDASGQPGVGGVTLYLNGTVGGMMTSLGAEVTDPTGATWREASWEKVDAVGQIIGEAALTALASASPAVAPRMTLGAHEIDLPVENTGYQAMFLIGVLSHRTADGYDVDQPLGDDNLPYAPTEVDLLELGPIRLLTMPGEVLPESFLGGYDGAYTPPGQAIVDTTQPNAPDLTQAPAPPYLVDRLGGTMRWCVSLGNDEVGYVIPPYNFVLADAGAYVLEAEGDHYEETNSLGAQTLPLLEAAADRLIGWIDAR
jgi:hypothetical protein